MPDANSLLKMAKRLKGPKTPNLPVPTGSQPAGFTPGLLASLQQTAGNRAVTGLLAGQRVPSAGVDAHSTGNEGGAGDQPSVDPFSKRVHIASGRIVNDLSRDFEDIKGPPFQPQRSALVHHVVKEMERAGFEEKWGGTSAGPGAQPETGAIEGNPVHNFLPASESPLSELMGNSNNDGPESHERVNALVQELQSLGYRVNLEKLGVPVLGRDFLP